jgi:GNAT superfamily N-acetyltransferase
MAEPQDIQVALEAAEALASARAEILIGLKAFNRQHIEPGERTEFAITARAPDNRLIGGLTGTTKYLWLYVEHLWIDEQHRRRGIGRRLLRAAEAHARDVGCRHAYVDTYDFQARPFYEHAGYKVFGEQDDYPPGHRRFFMSKRLEKASP